MAMSKGDTLSASYFRSLLEEETSKLKTLCDKWQAVLNDQPTETSVTNGQDKQEGLLNDDGESVVYLSTLCLT